MSERRVWNSSSSRATTVTVLLPGLRGTSAAKAMSPGLALGHDLEEDLLVVHEDEDVAEPGGRAAGRDAGRAGQVELLALDHGGAPGRVGAEGDARRLALPDAGHRALALALGRLDVRGGRRSRSVPSPTRPCRGRRSAAVTGSTAPRAASASGAEPAEAPERTGARSATTLTAPVAACRAGDGWGHGDLHLLGDVLLELLVDHRDAQREGVELQPLLHLDLEERAAGLAGRDGAQHGAPLLDEDLVVAQVLDGEEGLVAARAGADVLHVHPERRRPRPAGSGRRRRPWPRRRPAR